MRLLLVTPCFPPLQASGSLRTQGFARAWSQAGCAVTVLTTVKRADQAGMPLPVDGIDVAEVDYQAPALLEKLRQSGKRSQGADIPQSQVAPRRPSGVLAWLHRLKERTGVFSAIRMPDLTDYWIKPALAWARRQPPWDAVVSSFGPYSAHLVARALKHEGRANLWVADYRDLWTDNCAFTGLFPFTVWERRQEARCLREADLIVTVTETLAVKLRARTPRPVEVIYNGYNPEDSKNLMPEPFFPSDGIRRIVYTGTYYPQGHDATPLLRALKEVRRTRPDVYTRLRLEVAGWNTELWAQLARQHDVADAVRVHGPLSRQDSLRMQRDASALVLLDWDPRDGVLSGKVFEYLAVAAPILVVGGAPQSAMGWMMQRTRRGCHYGVDHRALTQALTDLVTAPERMTPIPDRGFLAKLTRFGQSLRLLQLIRDRLPPDVKMRRAA
ncbi:MAG: glycosyltransferase [Gemmataceae bacterium]|nr:glycosyltransferase [Gemmataceae bacterium]MCI0740244.1 glycosyltransferase [Gemmataceae bacterium]